MARQFQWSKEKAFEGPACSECGWIFSNPHLSFENLSETDLLKKAKAKFDDHKCSGHPRAPKQRQ
jgi:hypothetical protein